MQPVKHTGLGARLRDRWRTFRHSSAAAWRQVPGERKSTLLSLAVLSALLGILLLVQRPATIPPGHMEQGPQPPGLGAVGAAELPAATPVGDAAPLRAGGDAAPLRADATGAAAAPASEPGPDAAGAAAGAAEAAADTSIPAAAPPAPPELRRPVTGRLHQGYGVAYYAPLGEWRVHPGIDYHADPGTPVLAAAAGVVTTVEQDPLYGWTVQLDHGEGLATRYAGLGEPRVQPGDRVDAASLLGEVGDSGPAETDAGPHLHFEVRRSGEPVEPPTELR